MQLVIMSMKFSNNRYKIKFDGEAIVRCSFLMTGSHTADLFTIAPAWVDKTTSVAQQSKNENFMRVHTLTLSTDNKHFRLQRCVHLSYFNMRND